LKNNNVGLIVTRPISQFSVSNIDSIYIYQNFKTKEYKIFYNDEIRFPINLERLFFKQVGYKVKDFFSYVYNINVKIKDENIIWEFFYHEKN
jgi:hypothetical protein